MVELRPFKATILNPRMENVSELMCPVYDTIDASQYEHYSGRENNVIHVTTRKEGVAENEFVAHAKRALNRFFRNRILIECKRPAFYVYGLRYRLSEEIKAQIPAKEQRESYFAFGLVALVKVEELNEDSIVGHEKTFEASTRERYRLMKECGMNFSPITAEYTMPDHAINRIFEDYLRFIRPELKIVDDRKPVVDVELNGARHLLWEVSDEELVGKIQALMRDKTILILDGHHRYTASYLLSREREAEYTLMMLLEGGDRALLLLPWHRCVKTCHMEALWTRIEEHFSIERHGRGAIYSTLNEADAVSVGMYDGKQFYLLHADEQKIKELAAERCERVGLDILCLHEWLIEPAVRGKPEDISFTASPRDAVEKVDRGDYRVAFFLKPLRIADVEYKARVEQKAFPQKSTLFLPKVAEGVVMRRFRS